MIKHYLNILLLFVNCSLSYYLFKDSNFFYFSIAISFIIFSVIVSCGVLFLKFNYFLTSKTSLNNGYCLLTFDDGPDPLFTPQILKVLREENIKALFFIIGKKALEYPDLVRQIQDEGHLIGNHTFNHNIFLSLLPKKQILKEIHEGDEAIRSIIKQSPSYFRPPIGYTNPNYARVLKKLNLNTIGWSLRSYDTVYKQESKLIQRLINSIKKNDIVLFHDNLEITNNILLTFIRLAKEKDIIFVPLSSKESIFND